MTNNNEDEAQLLVPNDNNNNNNNNNNDESTGNVVPSLERLIDTEQWDVAYIRFQENPNEAYRIVDPTSRLGWTFLHWLCATPNTPLILLELVASLNPSAIIMPDNRYRDTPLHSLCRNSVTSADKVHVLLQYCPKVTRTPTDNSNSNNNETGEESQQQLSYCNILGRNIFGGTVLHSACNHNALIEIIQKLVEANPSIMSVRTLDGTHAITALWLSYIQTIPGTMTVAKLLKHGYYYNDDAIDRVFLKFWNKLEYLAIEYYYYCCCTTQSNNISQLEQQQLDKDDRTNYVLHGLIRCDVPINLFFLTLKMNVNYAKAIDNNGNTPLHLLVENRPYRLKEKDAIQAIVDVAPETILHRNNNDGNNPLLIAIQNKIPWENGIDVIVATRTTVINQKHTRTGLYPFQYAATQGGRVAIETTYQLLLFRPDLLLTTTS